MRDYISKLNDRNLQRRRESGLTTYALYSILIFIIYRIIEQYPSVPITSNFNEVFRIFAYTVNGGFFIFFIYLIYSIGTGHLSPARLVLKPSNESSLLETAIDYFVTGLLPLSVNLYFAIQIYLSAGEFSIYFIVFTLIFLTATFFYLFDELKNRKISVVYEIFDGTGSRTDDRNLISGLFYVLSLVSIVVTFYQIYAYRGSFSKLNVMTFTFLILAIPLILMEIIDLRKSDGFSKALENLEYEVYVRDLKDDQIREKLQKNYLGFLLLDWISLKLKEVEEFESDQDQKLEEIKKLEADLAGIDSEVYAIEHKGRREIIEAEKKKYKDGAIGFYSNNLREFERIWRKREIEVTERAEFNNLAEKIAEAVKKYDKEIRKEILSKINKKIWLAKS